ncbi:TPA: hypothetical protein DIV55_07180 [Patescibacteria group bacterium]|uniref:Bifunctional protein FolD n=1 Tax=Candidatus Gottesmanbacteria bacterium GW2011_GWA1_43_11 TaxID=1618436 RepID=A0A0G1CIK3_9BACT|nr:MAG: Bifunctional protein FolD [Candidatus Gottesmanbacteria bacterium GW2011_GWA1_43_11]HCS79485.1 hypothetical protein [Patescibacteria group bacterium]
MKIDGQQLARRILRNLHTRVKALQKTGITPHLAVIWVGNDPASASFIKQKSIAACVIGARLSLHQFKKTPLYQKLAEFIREMSRNPEIHGIIVQRPLPPSLSAQSLCKLVPKNKDVDGFLPKSAHVPPIGSAMFRLFNEIYFNKLQKTASPEDNYSKPLLTWLKEKNIVLLGKGETAGKPIAATLSKYRLPFIMLNSRSDHPEEYLKEADIVISAIGKAGIVNPAHLKQGVILIGVGMERKQHKLKGDYDENQVEKIARFYTPMPGGTGPVNVACLMENLVNAATLTG